MATEVQKLWDEQEATGEQTVNQEDVDKEDDFVTDAITGRPYRPLSKGEAQQLNLHLQEQWEQLNPGLSVELPVDSHRQSVVSTVQSSRVVVIAGETGCGKTTRIPRFLLEECVRGGEGASCNILVTQPRRISAVSVAQRVADEMGPALKRSVGYQVDTSLQNSAFTECIMSVRCKNYYGQLTIDRERCIHKEMDGYLKIVVCILWIFFTYSCVIEVETMDAEILIYYIKENLDQNKINVWLFFFKWVDCFCTITKQWILSVPRCDSRAAPLSTAGERCSSSLWASCWGSCSPTLPWRESATWWWMRSMRGTSTQTCCWPYCAPAWKRTPTYEWFSWALLGTTRGWPSTSEAVPLWRCQVSCTQWRTGYLEDVLRQLGRRLPVKERRGTDKQVSIDSKWICCFLLSRSSHFPTFWCKIFSCVVCKRNLYVIVFLGRKRWSCTWYRFSSWCHRKHWQTRRTR